MKCRMVVHNVHKYLGSSVSDPNYYQYIGNSLGLRPHLSQTQTVTNTSREAPNEVRKLGYYKIEILIAGAYFQN